MKSSRFMRHAYAHHAAQLADELLDWAKIFGRRAYGDYTDPRSTRYLELCEAREIELQELAMELQRVSMRLEAMQ